MKSPVSIKYRNLESGVIPQVKHYYSKIHMLPDSRWTRAKEYKADFD
jgi:hypothetical protein